MHLCTAGTLQVPLRRHVREEPMQLYLRYYKDTSRDLGVTFTYREFPVIQIPTRFRTTSAQLASVSRAFMNWIAMVVR